jgi:hypothetical protein
LKGSPFIASAAPHQPLLSFDLPRLLPAARSPSTHPRPRHPHRVWGTAGPPAQIRRSRHDQVKTVCRAAGTRARHSVRPALHCGHATPVRTPRSTSVPSRPCEGATLETRWAWIPPPNAVGAPPHCHCPGAPRFGSDGAPLRSLAKSSLKPSALSLWLSSFQLFQTRLRPSFCDYCPADPRERVPDHRSPISPPCPQMYCPQQPHTCRPQVFTVDGYCHAHGSF